MIPSNIKNLRSFLFVATLFIFIFAFLPHIASAQPLAFPTAEGFGAHALGGRGGTVIKIVNLNDSGSGSLRACTDASGPRTCVFRVGGTIELQSMLRIFNPYITIAGQTAPGGGILIKKALTVTQHLFSIATHNVIVRHIRFRSGPGGGVDTIHTLTTAAPHDLILDHVSASWGTDENISLSGNNITLQWSINSEGLFCSTHPQGCHSMGSLLNGTNISIHHTIYAHNQERMPRVQSNGGLEVINNIIYNPEFHGSWGPSHITSSPLANYIGNYVKKGTNSSTLDWYISATQSSAQIYTNDNIVPVGIIRPSESGLLVSRPRPVAPVPITVSPAQESYVNVLASSGAFPRDSVDTRIVNDVTNGTGQIIDDPSEVGGFPTIANGTPPQDTDQDGMSDAWESSCGLNTNNSADGAQTAPNGYTNLENYLNGLAGDSIPMGVCGGLGGGPDTIAPSIPTNLAASAISSSQINLSWTASTDNIGVTGYQVDRCQGASCTNFVQIATPSGTVFADTSLTSSTTYRYRVRATDAAGNLSGYSTIVSGTTQGGPPSPQCSDGLDNDGDSLTDYPDDPGCTSATDNDETDSVAPVFSDNFDSGISWTQSGSVIWYESDPHNGSHSVQLRKTGSIEKSIPLTGLQDIVVSFNMGANSLETGENVQALYYDGSTWQLLAQIDNGSANENNLLNPYQFMLPSTVNNLSTFALRFVISGNRNNDQAYIDNVVVQGVAQ